MYKYNNLFTKSSSNQVTTNTNYVKELNNYIETAKNYSNFSTKVDDLTNANKNLANYTKTLNNIQTTYTNPVTGEKTDTNQTIDAIQTSRIKNLINNYVETYNKSVNAAENLNSENINKEFNNINITKNLENLGITKNNDGTLSFNETQFNKAVVAGETKIADLKGAFNDLTNLTSATDKLITNVSKEVKQTYETVNNAVVELKENLIEQYNSLYKSNINNVLNNSMNSLLSSLGFGQNINNLI